MAQVGACCYNCASNIICKNTQCHCHGPWAYTSTGDRISVNDMEPGKVYYLEGRGGIFVNIQVPRKEPSMTCDCCSKDLDFWGKYVVDNGKRYCVFCYDVCKAGQYNHCVMSVYKTDRAAGAYGMNPAYIPPKKRQEQAFVELINQTQSMHITNEQFAWAVKTLAQRIRR